jgi:hypothetical protein
VPEKNLSNKAAGPANKFDPCVAGSHPGRLKIHLVFKLLGIQIKRLKLKLQQDMMVV